jgi:SOS response regulatory protein OraA/RecX
VKHGALALRRALELIARRPRTEFELRSALAEQFSAHDVDHAVERLRALRYVDDAALAAEYVGRRRARERAATLLRRELLARGVPTDDADRALLRHDDHAAAARAAELRLPALRRVDPQRRRRRLRDHLRRRGFGESVIASVVMPLLGEDEAAA